MGQKLSGRPLGVGRVLQTGADGFPSLFLGGVVKLRIQNADHAARWIHDRFQGKATSEVKFRPAAELNAYGAFCFSLVLDPCLGPTERWPPVALLGCQSGIETVGETVQPTNSPKTALC